MTRHRKSRFEAHQLGCREGAPRPSDESSPPPRAGHLSGTGHLLPMRRGAGDAARLALCFLASSLIEGSYSVNTDPTRVDVGVSPACEAGNTFYDGLADLFEAKSKRRGRVGSGPSSA